jgi:DNA primase
LRLIQTGFTISVAGQGTAFGEGHMEELLRLGVKQVFLALDADKAGQEAACKIGDMFQKKGAAVKVVALPPGKDPDSLLKEEGPDAFKERMEKSLDYLTFLIQHRSQSIDISQPAAKSQLAEEIAARIRAWEHPVMVHESLRQLAALLMIPEETLGTNAAVIRSTVKKSASAKLLGFDIDPHRILEMDILRWALLSGEEQPRILSILQLNDVPQKMKVPLFRQMLETCLDAQAKNQPCDFLSLASLIDEKEEPGLVAQILQKKVNLQKAEAGCLSTVTSFLQRDWLEETEKIKIKIQSGGCSDEEAFELARRFSDIKKHPPQVKVPQ